MKLLGDCYDAMILRHNDITYLACATGRNDGAVDVIHEAAIVRESKEVTRGNRNS